jgi:hypothetical protein
MYRVTSNNQNFLNITRLDEAKRLAKSLRGFVFNMLNELVYSHEWEEEVC